MKEERKILPIKKAINRARLRDDPYVGIHRQKIYNNYN